MPISKASSSAVAPGAKGDLVVGTTTNDSGILAVGSANQVLTVDSSTATGLKWAAAAGGGKVLQVVSSVHTTDVGMSTTTFTDTGVSQAITPTSASSKILVVAIQSVYVESSPEVTTAVGMRILRDSTTIFTQGATSQSFGARAIEALNNVPLVYLDSPATTSSITYKIQGRNNDTTSGRYAYYNVGDSVITLLEIGA